MERLGQTIRGEAENPVVGAAGALAAMRTVVALATPFTSDGNIEPDAFAAHLRWLTQLGVDGVLVCGTTGEGPLLSDDEVVTVTRHARDATSTPLIVNVGRPGTLTTLHLAARALEAGADALCVVVPYYYTLGQAEIAAHFQTLLRELSGAVLFAYSIPSHAGNDLEPDTFAALLNSGLYGLKDSSKSVERHAAYAAASRRAGVPCGLLCGSDNLVAGARWAGGTGSATAMANVCPQLVAAVHAAFDAGRPEDAAAAQVTLSDARAQLVTGATARAVKLRLHELLGDIGIDYPTGVRGPL
jgi:dihydrodipicolinate synthase/N-acetylneuraminate lyase